MIRLGLRLTSRRRPGGAVRLVVTAAAVALGVGLLLVTLAGINAVNAQNARYAWLNWRHNARAPTEPPRRTRPPPTRCGGWLSLD